MAGTHPLHHAVPNLQEYLCVYEAKNCQQLINARSGLSLNNCMWAGTMAPAKFLAVLIHWRMVEVALMADIAKAYRVIKTREHELHIRRFLHRNSLRKPW